MKNRVQYLKKTGVWLLFSLVVLWSLGIFAAAEGTIQLSAGETASGTDDTVTVPLVFTRNPGFTSLKIKVTYEKDKFTLTAVESAAVRETTVFQGEEGDEILFLATEDCLEGGTLAELRFKVADGVSKGDYRLDFSAVGAVNAAYEPVGVSFEEGKITLIQDMVLVRSLSFKQEVLTLERNTQSTLEVTVWPENAVNTKLTFQSSDPKVATVTSGGKVTVLSSGETTITVRSSDGKAQADCRITVPEMSGKETFLVVLSELNTGFVQTLKLFFVTLLGAIPLGLLIALCTMSKFRPLSALFKVIVWIVRGSPLMIQLMIIFYFPGLILQNNIWGSGDNGRFIAAAVAFILNYACYFSEIYRSGIQGVPKGQQEAGQVLGLTKGQIFFKVTLLQMIKRIVPPMANEIITLVKDTSLARIIALQEIIWKGEAFIKGTRGVSGIIWPLFFTAVYYLAFSGILTVLLNRLEKKLNYFN